MRLFPGAVAGWLPNISDRELELHFKASRLLGADELISSLPDGPGTLMLAENDTYLSPGKRH